MKGVNEFHNKQYSKIQKQICSITTISSLLIVKSTQKVDSIEIQSHYFSKMVLYFANLKSMSYTDSSMFVDKDNNDFISVALKTITLSTDRPYILNLAKLKQTTANILSNKKYLWEIGISTDFNSPKNRAIKKHTKEFLHKHFPYNKTHITKLLNQQTTV